LSIDNQFFAHANEEDSQQYSYNRETRAATRGSCTLSTNPVCFSISNNLARDNGNSPFLERLSTGLMLIWIELWGSWGREQRSTHAEVAA
jgi:hypothetical protein